MKSVLVSVLLCAGIVLFGTSARADETISYNYAELSYVHSRADLGPTFGDVDGDGGRLEFSLEVIDNFYAVGNYETIDLDDVTVQIPGGTVTASALDLDTWSVGVGWHTDVGAKDRSFGTYKRDRWAFFAEARYLTVDGGGGADVDGYKAKLGFRGINHTKFEFVGAVGYRELENVDGDVTLEGRLLYSLSDDFEIQFGVDWLEDFTRGFVGVRYNFAGFGY